MCHDGNSGQGSVAYYNTSYVRVTYSGVIWTNCGSGTYASINNNGYYVSRCTHEGTVSWVAFCVTWNYSP